MKNKLAALAAHLETTDAPYDQKLWSMCAAGHYFHFVACQPQTYQIAVIMGTMADLLPDEFGISLEDANELFSGFGCGGAKTAKEAAAYIRNFLKAREPKPVFQFAQAA